MVERATGRDKRRKLLLELVQKEMISSQNQLRERLSQSGIVANQATLSRDLRELAIIKVPHLDGSRYVLASGQMDEQGQYQRRFSELVVSVDQSINLLVVKTPPGSAQPCALALDKLRIRGVLGTVAGDDTIFLVLGGDEPFYVTADRVRGMAGLPPLGPSDAFPG